MPEGVARPSQSDAALRQGAYREGLKHQLAEIHAQLKDLRIETLTTKAMVAGMAREFRHD